MIVSRPNQRATYQVPRRAAAVIPACVAVDLPAADERPEEDAPTLTLYPIGGRLVALPGPPAAVAVRGLALDGQVPAIVHTGTIPNCQ